MVISNESIDESIDESSRESLIKKIKKLRENFKDDEEYIEAIIYESFLCGYRSCKRDIVNTLIKERIDI